MATVAALSGKIKFANTGKTQYRVETLLNNRKSTWVQHFNSFDAALEYIESEKDRFENSKFLVTEVFTKTLGVF